MSARHLAIVVSLLTSWATTRTGGSSSNFRVQTTDEPVEVHLRH